MCLEILLKMVYARNEEEYSTLNDELKQTVFESNCHSIHHEWVDGLKMAVATS